MKPETKDMYMILSKKGSKIYNYFSKFQTACPLNQLKVEKVSVLKQKRLVSAGFDAYKHQ